MRSTFAELKIELFNFYTIVCSVLSENNGRGSVGRVVRRR